MSGRPQVARPLAGRRRGRPAGPQLCTEKEADPTGGGRLEAIEAPRRRLRMTAAETSGGSRYGARDGFAVTTPDRPRPTLGADEKGLTAADCLRRAVAWFGGIGVIVERGPLRNGARYPSRVHGAACPELGPAPTASPSDSSRRSPIGGPTARLRIIRRAHTEALPGWPDHSNFPQKTWLPRPPATGHTPRPSRRAGTTSRVTTASRRGAFPPVHLRLYEHMFVPARCITGRRLRRIALLGYAGMPSAFQQPEERWLR